MGGGRDEAGECAEMLVSSLSSSVELEAIEGAVGSEGG